MLRVMRYPRYRARAGRQLALLAATCLSLGCLAPGAPPHGQHIILDRTLTRVFFVPSESAGIASNLLAAGPIKSVGATGLAGIDLYLFRYQALSQPIAGLAAIAPTVESFVLGDPGPSGDLLHSDKQGRLVYLKAAASAAAASPTYVTRFDFSTGSEERLALPNQTPPGFLLSGSRTRLYAGGFLFDSDGITQLAPLSIAEPTFIADDLYYGIVTSDGIAPLGSTIVRRRPGGAPETVLSSAGVVTFTPIPSDVAPQLLVSWAAAGADEPFMVLDSKRLTNALLPQQRGQAQFLSASSDGHLLVFREPLPEQGNRLFFYDWTTGGFASLVSGEAPIAAPITSIEDWRPGHEELWALTAQGDAGGLAVWQPDHVSAYPGLAPVPRTIAPDGRVSMFTRDGSHWLGLDMSVTNNGTPAPLVVGSADDPSAPCLRTHPTGEWFHSVWETRDGLLLVGASSFDENRLDLYLVDPAAGSSRILASGGHLVALGRTRALALLNWEVSSSTGDLVLLELATGRQTMVAQDVYQVAVDPGASADPPVDADLLAPGTTIAFLSRNRLASPYDGLWVAQLP